MYDERAERDAKRYGILDRMQALEDDLMQIQGIVNVEFDIRGLMIQLSEMCGM